jgi:hypothetical protein
MQLTLFIPGLLLPGEALADTAFDLDTPALSRLLGYAERTPLAADWLLSTFGITAKPPLPAAALRKVGADGTAEGAYICFDPVHWQVGRNGITLADPAQLELSQAEADALCAAVQPAVADWGTLTTSSPRHWELQLKQMPQLQTRALAECIGQPIAPDLPGGADGSRWRQRLNEIQTLLHAHPVNRQREAHGKPRVNSLWPWGSGALADLQPVGNATCSVVWADDSRLAGLALLQNMPCLATPEQFQPASGAVLCQLDNLLSPARSLAALNWRQALLALEQQWFAPLLRAVKKGECQTLQLIAGSAHEAVEAIRYTVRRRDVWRFWRRPRPLSALP